MLRIDLSAFALSHVVPAGGAGSTALRYRLLSSAGVRRADVVFVTVVQPVGSAVVLNLMVWPVLLITLPRGGAGPAFTVGATAGLVLLSVSGLVLFALLREQRWVVALIRAAGPRLRADRVESAIRRFAEHLRQLGADRRVLGTAIGWAAVNWLLDAMALWVFLAAFGSPLAPDRLFAAYGLASVAGAIPITPGGLGVVEGVLAPTLVAAGAPHGAAILAVLTWRLVNFWLPIPVGGLAYLTLRTRLPRRLRGGRHAVGSRTPRG